MAERASLAASPKPVCRKRIRLQRESGRSGWSGVGGGPDPSADLLGQLGQLDDDPLRAADVAEPVPVLIALQLADELRATGSQAGDDGVDVFDGECDITS